jgi:hypothetical protein
MDSNLLKEAIADAKAVRATALANAKVALEEAFAPRFEAMFSEKLKEEAGVNTPSSIPPAMEEEQEVSESEVDELIKELEAEVGGEEDELGVGTPDTGEETPTDVPPESDLDPTDDLPPVGGDVSPTGMGAEGGAPLTAGTLVRLVPVNQGEAGLMGGPSGAPVPPTPPVPSAGGVPGAEGEELPPSEGAPEDEEEVDLNELLESLKEEAENEEAVNESVPVGTSAIGGSKAGGTDNKKPSSDASQSSHVENAGKDRVAGGEGYKGGPADPTQASRPNQGKNVTKTNLSTPGGALKEDIENGVPDGTVTSKEPTDADRPNQAPHATKTDLSTPALKCENVALKRQLAEAYETVKYIKGQLNEINLLNAKLLYTNKLLKEFSMTNEQKMRIVEMFDLSKSVREVKLTYATMAESLNFSGDMRKKPVVSSSVQSITEGIASKPVASTKPSKVIITEGNKFAARMKQLAGIRSEKK